MVLYGDFVVGFLLSFPLGNAEGSKGLGFWLVHSGVPGAGEDKPRSLGGKG